METDDYDYSNRVLDRKIDQLRKCNEEIEMMIKSIDTDSSASGDSIVDMYEEDESQISIDPHFIDQSLEYQGRRLHSTLLHERAYRPQNQSVQYPRRHFIDGENRRVFEKVQREPNKAKITFSMKRPPFMPKPPSIAINKNVQPRYRNKMITNNLENEFQRKIAHETAEFVNRCVSAPLRRSYGSSNDVRTSAIKSAPRPSKSPTRSVYAVPKRSTSISLQKKDKSFRNPNDWVPNGKIKKPLSASMNKLDMEPTKEEKFDPKAEKLKQLEQAWKPGGKIKSDPLAKELMKSTENLRSKSGTRDSQTSLRSSTKNLNKDIADKNKSKDKKWIPGGKPVETPYPKQVTKEPTMSKTTSNSNLNTKEDTKSKELERKWKPNGKIKESFTPFKSVEIKNEEPSKSVDKKKEAQDEKIKELESNWNKPKPKTTLPLSTVDVSEPIKSMPTEKTQKKEDTKFKELETKWKPAGKNIPKSSKAPTSDVEIQDKPKPEQPPAKPIVKPKPLNKDKLQRQLTKTLPPTNPQQPSKENGSQISTSSKKNPDVRDESPVGHSTINAADSKNDDISKELENKADLEFENDIKKDLLSKVKNGAQTSTPKKEKPVEAPKPVDNKNKAEQKVESPKNNKPADLNEKVEFENDDDIEEKTKNKKENDDLEDESLIIERKPEEKKEETKNENDESTAIKSIVFNKKENDEDDENEDDLDKTEKDKTEQKSGISDKKSEEKVDDDDEVNDNEEENEEDEEEAKPIWTQVDDDDN